MNTERPTTDFIPCEPRPSWLAAGTDNYWIREAYDPPFGASSFYRCVDLDALKDRFRHGNWCLGQAYVLGEPGDDNALAFINQVDGGDEWLVVRGDVVFESLSAGYMVRADEAAGTRKLDEWIEDVLAATDKQLRDLEYLRDLRSARAS